MRNVLIVAVLAVLVGVSDGQTDPSKDLLKTERFDKLVREDFFAGFAGDEERMARGLKNVNETLAKNPKHSEALVWRGAGRVFQSSKAFQANMFADGMTLWTAGLKDMDDAVALDPTNPGVRIPRAAALRPAIHNAPAIMTKPLIPKVVSDFETMYAQQKNDLDKLGVHPRGELRMGLADAYRLAGELDKSRAQLEAVAKELPETKYAARAKEWLAAPPTAKLMHNCIGCHGK